MRVNSKIFCFVVVDMLVTLTESTTVGAQTIQHPGYLNQQPTERTLQATRAVEDNNFVIYFPNDSEALDKLEETRDEQLNYGDSTIQKDNQVVLLNPRDDLFIQRSEVTTLKNSPRQEEGLFDSKNRFQELVKKINHSNFKVPSDKRELYDFSSNTGKMVRSVTTTVRPIYDQIPRPMLFENGVETDSF